MTDLSTDLNYAYNCGYGDARHDRGNKAWSWAGKARVQYEAGYAAGSRTEAQQALWDALPPTSTAARGIKHYGNLSQCPDEICIALLPLANALNEGGFNAIQAHLKLKKLSEMTPEQVIEAFASSN